MRGVEQPAELGQVGLTERRNRQVDTLVLRDHVRDPARERLGQTIDVRELGRTE